VYPILVNSAAGARSVDRVLVWSAINMGASRMQILRKIVLPGAAPSIFAGFRIALPLALVVVIITEMIGSADGLGHFIMVALADLRTDRMFAGVVAIAVVGLVFDLAVTRGRRRAVFWDRQAAVLDLRH
jgi:NitT/TauT family transport system permease protein